MLINIFKALLLTSSAGALLSLILLLIKPVTKRCFGTVWQYYAWLMVLAVMMLPVTISLPEADTVEPVVQAVPLPAQTAQAENTVQTAPVQQAVAVAPPMETVIGAAQEAGANITDITCYIWLMGCLLILGMRLVSYAMFRRSIKKNSTVISCPEAGKLTARKTKLISSPLIVGLFKTSLLLPDIDIPDEHMDYILRHELMHYKRHDLWYKWFVMLVSSVHWFNPFVYLVSKQIDEECEMSCDYSVVRDMDKAQQTEYMGTILSLIVSTKPKQLTTTMASSKSQIKRRFTMIRKTRKVGRARAAVSAITACLILSTSVLASGVFASAMKETDDFGNLNNYNYDDTIDIADRVIGVEVFNGDVKLEYTNKPYVEDGEVYLPLRETLAAFDLNDVSWDNGQIVIAMPLIETNAASMFEPATSSRIAIGSDKQYFDSSEDGMNESQLRTAPVLKNEVAYAPYGVFEHMIWRGQLPNIMLNLIQPKDPAAYYTADEEVFIGTAAQQDSYRPIDVDGAPKIVKRILVNEANEAMAVVTVENQTVEVINRKLAILTPRLHTGSYMSMFDNDMFIKNIYSNNVKLMTPACIDRDVATIAYIPPAYQINIDDISPTKYGGPEATNR